MSNLIKTIEVRSIEQLTNNKPLNNETESLDDAHQTNRSLQEKKAHIEHEIEQLLEHKQQINKQVEKEIIEQRNAWQQEKQTYIDQAHKQGYEDGYTEGQTASLAQYSDLLEQANEMVRLAQNDYDATIKQTEPAIIKLAIHIAEKVIHKQLAVDEQVIKRIATDAIAELADQQEIKIKVSPNDYDHLLHQKKDIENVIDHSSKLLILIDETLEHGMCLIEYPTGKTDASISTQLEFIENELLNMLTEKDL